jgi:hypothetical protein
LQASPKLAFTRVSAQHHDVSGEGGALLRATGRCANGRAAVCAGHVMSTGQHAADFTIVSTENSSTFVGLARPDIDVPTTRDAYARDKFWGLYGISGNLYHSGKGKSWTGQEPFGQGDVVGLLLDCDAGTLAVKKNGKLLGVAATGLTGPLCWAAAIYAHTTIRIAAADGW